MTMNSEFSCLDTAHQYDERKQKRKKDRKNKTDAIHAISCAMRLMQTNNV